MTSGGRIVFLNTIFNKATFEIHFRLKLYALYMKSNYLEQHSVIVSTTVLCSTPRQFYFWLHFMLFVCSTFLYNDSEVVHGCLWLIQWIAAVRCLDAPLECQHGQAPCPSVRRCINTRYFCDTDNDCRDNSDERESFCSELINNVII